MGCSLVTVCALLTSAANIFAQGFLTPPPGAPAPTMKTLDQVEPRTIINATNTPGDANNMFIISSSGSYYLTGNVTGVSGKNGILITAYNITVDLNGFSLAGVTGSLAGISLPSGFGFDYTVRNGIIHEWGGAGIDLSNTWNSLIEDLLVYANGGAGIKMGDSCKLRDCVSRSNTLYGIVAGTNSLVSHCAASGNGVGGISVGTGSTIAGCAASGNVGGSGGTGVGILTGNGCTVGDSTASYNTAAYGIQANPGSTITHCTASNNTSAQAISAGILAAGSTVIGCTAANNTNTNSASHTTGMGIYVNGPNSTIRNCNLFGNKGDGINVSAGNCIVADNQCNNNGVDGIFASNSLNRIEDNHVNFNGAAGIRSFGGDWIIRNTSSNNSAGNNFVPATGADIGPIQTASTATNPFANLQ
jgi:hypothetical protein